MSKSKWENIGSWMATNRRRLRSIVARNSPKLTPPDHDDVVQEISLRLLQQKSAIRNIEALTTWLTPRVVIDELRKRRRHAELDLEGDASMDHQSNTDVMASYTASETKQRLLSAFGKLQPHYQRIIKARYFEGNTLAAIAAAESIPESTVRHYLKEGMKSLAMILQLISLSGTVVDESGNALPGARVVVRGKEYRENDTDKHGQFSFMFQKTGHYMLNISKVGYVSFRQVINLIRKMELPLIKLYRCDAPVLGDTEGI